MTSFLHWLWFSSFKMFIQVFSFDCWMMLSKWVFNSCTTSKCRPMIYFNRWYRKTVCTSRLWIDRSCDESQTDVYSSRKIFKAFITVLHTWSCSRNFDWLLNGWYIDNMLVGISCTFQFFLIILCCFYFKQLSNDSLYDGATNSHDRALKLLRETICEAKDQLTQAVDITPAPSANVQSLATDPRMVEMLDCYSQKLYDLFKKKLEND